jgi:pyruvate/2-oxoglutarate dehydrogenase complex dihydrolipoamide dehydrogenase (E3) component
VAQPDSGPLEHLRHSLIEPLDRYNQQWLAQVRPTGWTNPESKERYHLVVIGAGPGGLLSAAIAAGLGARVALVERHLMGGDCLNVGCVPSKALIAAARSWAAAASSHPDFGGPRIAGAGDFGAAMERVRRLRADLSQADSVSRYRERGVDLFLGEGRFSAPDRLTVHARTLAFRRAIIATGARPAVPPVPGLEAAGYLTNETLFTLTRLPRRLVVVGSGPVGCEMAQAFARLGSEVTLLNDLDHLLPLEDADAGRIVERAMAGDGVQMFHRCRMLRVHTRAAERVIQLESEGQSREIAADEILIAVGRIPNVEGLGLEAAGVDYGAGGIAVNDRLRTSNSRIFAIGDCWSKHQFTHVADAHARLVIGNALFFGLGGGKASRLITPWVTYTSPEIAHVGLYEREAIERGHRVHTLTFSLEEVDRAKLEGQTEGFFRVHLKRGSDRILGATLVAEHAGEMIGEIILAMRAGVGLSTIAGTIHPYPTQSEVFRKAGDAWRKGKLTPKVRRLLGWFFRSVR